MNSLKQTARSDGFSLLELFIAMAITLTLMAAASSLIASALRTRTRENQKSDALADTQRALNIMSREIADSGFNINNNGIVEADSGPEKIRIRSNLNKYDYSPSVTDAMRSDVGETGEDITYFLNLADKTKYLARHDKFGTGSTVLANRVDSMKIHYFNQKVTYTATPGASDISNISAAEVLPSQANYVVIAVSVTLDEIATPGAPGYQRGYTVLLCSDVILRNSGLWNY